MRTAALQSVLCLVLALGAARAEIIDRVAVSIGNQAITESELIHEIRVTAFFNGKPPEFGPEARREAASRLIEQKLVKKEVELSRYPGPAGEEVDAAYEALRQDQQRFPNPAAFDAALAKSGLTAGAIKERLRWQLALLNFIDIRFQPAVQVTEQDIRNYFEKNVQAGRTQTVSLEEYRDQIERSLTGERVDRQLNEWLQEARKRSDIRLHEEVFR